MLPTAEKVTQSSAWEEDMIVSYATSRTKSAKRLQLWNGCVGQESTSDGDLNGLSECRQHRGRLDSISRPEDFGKLQRRCKAPTTGEADAEQMADLIQKELKTLVRLAPSVSLLAVLLSDTVFRYTGCRKGSKRISSSLPWILNRIQELIVYVVAKRKGASSYGCLQQEPTIGEIQKSVEEEKADSGLVLPPEQQVPTEIAKSEKIDAIDAAGARPGVQILLRVKPERQKKRFFQTLSQKPPETQVNNCFVQPHESAFVPVIHVVKPRPQPQVLRETKREVSKVKEYSFGVCLLFKYCTRTPASVLELTLVEAAVAILKARETLNLKSVAPLEERRLQWKKNSLTVLTKKELQAAPSVSQQEKKNIESQGISRASEGPRVSSQKESIPPGVKSGIRSQAGSQRKLSRHSSNERRSYGISDFLANAPDLVKELLKEAEEEKMEIKKLEVGVNGLKDLMLEVHRNQIELSRFLLENGIYSQPIIKLTNPHMLEEESAAVRKLEDSLAGNGSRSAESLQGEIEELKERCIMKNKMIVSLVKGLQSDVPHEWWEEMMSPTEVECRPSEEINYERFSELYENFSFFLMNGEQASRKKMRAEEQPSEGGKQGSDSEAPGLSDSDRESDYLTGLEELADGAAASLLEEDPQKRASNPLASDVAHTSSFIQNILYEDSRAGVAVVDLFVTVKTVKDNLDFLSRCNNEVFDKIDDLNRDAKAFKEQYDAFLCSMHKFLTKMDADAQILDMLVPKAKRRSVTNLSDASSNGRKYLKSSGQESDEDAGEQEQMRVRRSQTEYEEEAEKLEEEWKSCGWKEQCSRECSECGGADSSKSGSGKSKDGCLGCLLRPSKEGSFGRPPVLSEAFMGSFVASLLWLQNGRESSVTSSKSSSPVGSVMEEKKKKPSENLSLRKSAVRMISYICEIINGTACELKEQSVRTTDDTDLELSRKPSLASELVHPRCSAKASRTDVKSIVEASPDEVSCLYRGQNTFLKAEPKKGKSKESSRTTEESLSEVESDFEEALSFPFVPSTHFDLKAKPSVTCMGDLSKAVTAKKSTSAFTPTVPSWIEKLSTEIISKLRKRKSKASVRVLQQPYKKPNGLKTASGRLEFTFPANTSVGVFDVTVVQYKKSRLLRDRLLQQKTMPTHTCASDQIRDRQSSGGVMSVKEEVCSWSEDSLRNVDSDVVSNSGESDFEEFIEIFLENPKENKRNGKLIRASQEKGNLKMIELKTCRPNFFEIQKRWAVNFAQEIIQKGSSSEQKVEKYKKQVEEQKILSLNPGEKKQKQVVIEGSTSDLVIYIQVEVEGSSTSNSGGVYLEYQKSSFGTQTAEDKPGDDVFSSLKGERTIKLEEENRDGMSLYQIWRGCDKSSSTDLKTMLSTEKLKEDERVLAVKEPKEKTVTFNEELSEVLIEREIQETYPREEINAVVGTDDARDVYLREAKHRADVWLAQQNLQWVQRGEMRRPRRRPADMTPAVDAVPLELQKALRLIREIESDVVDVKLSDAISILPRLETELRKHLQDKVKGLGEKGLGREDSLRNFFSAINFWPQESVENESETSEDRLNNLLGMLADLEEAVKSSEYSGNDIDLCQCDSSKVYKLLQALTASIRELEGRPDMMSLSQTLEIASQLDTAVREYDSIVRRQPVDYVSSERSGRRNWKKHAKTAAEMSVMQHLKNVRKKVFGMVEEEATEVEGRIERDLDRLDRLEGENDEVLMFLETFLQKTERRVVELADLKSELKELSSSLNKMYEELREKMAEKRKKEMEVLQIKGPEDQNLLTDSSFDSLSIPASADRSEPIRETISGLLIALDTLKSRAKQKKELCREILFTGALDKTQESENSSRRSSRSSFTTKHGDKLHATVKEFKKIGHASLYLAWTKPEGALKSSIVGYQIYVNEKLNQKVRNPHRLQAVLYSVDLTGKVDIQLYALTENGPKILLATVNYQDD